MELVGSDILSAWVMNDSALTRKAKGLAHFGDLLEVDSCAVYVPCVGIKARHLYWGLAVCLRQFYSVLLTRAFLEPPGGTEIDEVRLPSFDPFVVSDVSLPTDDHLAIVYILSERTSATE